MIAELTDGMVNRLLIRLDWMLRAAVERMLANLGPDAAADPFRGLYISRDEATRLLDAWPGGTAWPTQPSPAEDLTESDRGDAVILARSKAQLHKMCQQVGHRHQVLDEWGFGRRLSSLAPSAEQ